MSTASWQISGLQPDAMRGPPKLFNVVAAEKKDLTPLCRCKQVEPGNADPSIGVGVRTVLFYHDGGHDGV